MVVQMVRTKPKYIHSRYNVARCAMIKMWVQIPPIEKKLKKTLDKIKKIVYNKYTR